MTFPKLVVYLLFAIAIALEGEDSHAQMGDAKAKCAKSGCYSKIEAIEEAKRVILARGFKLSHYRSITANLNGGIWFVKFEGRNNVLGDYCAVLLDNKTRKITFIHGE